MPSRTPGGSRQTLRVEREGHVVRLLFTCARFTHTAAEHFRDACESVSRDDSVRVLALGVAERKDWPGTQGEETARGGPPRMADAVAALEVPTVAVLRGRVRDLAMEIALACDLRVAASDTRLALGYLSRGAIPSNGGTQRLPRLIGPARAAEMLLLGGEVTAAEAMGWGLIHRVVPAEDLDETVAQLAATIAKAAPIAARYAKEAAARGLDLSMEAGMRLEADLSFLLHSTEDRREGLKSFFEKRDPEYKGR